MARDRQRAKQRRDRARRAPGATAERRPPRHTEPAVPSIPEPDGVLDPAPAEETPDTLDHASAEVDLANAQLALGRAQAGDDEPYAEDEDDSELEEEAVEAAPPAAIPRDERSAVTQQGGNRVTSFLAASWRELQRVQWPDRRQVAQATGVVVAFVIIAGAFLGLADVVFNKLVDLIL